MAETEGMEANKCLFKERRQVWRTHRQCLLRDKKVKLGKEKTGRSQLGLGDGGWRGKDRGRERVREEERQQVLWSCLNHLCAGSPSGLLMANHPVCLALA